MRVDPRPAALVINNIIPGDEGVYKCRADFKKSPTKHYVVNVTIISELTSILNIPNILIVIT